MLKTVKRTYFSAHQPPMTKEVLNFVFILELSCSDTHAHECISNCLRTLPLHAFGYVSSTELCNRHLCHYISYCMPPVNPHPSTCTGSQTLKYLLLIEYVSSTKNACQTSTVDCSLSKTEPTNHAHASTLKDNFHHMFRHPLSIHITYASTWHHDMFRHILSLYTCTCPPHPSNHTSTTTLLKFRY